MAESKRFPTVVMPARDGIHGSPMAGAARAVEPHGCPPQMEFGCARSTHHIFAFVGGLRKVDEVWASFSDVRFLNLDDDPALEVVLRDTSFVYWYAPFSATPSSECPP